LHDALAIAFGELSSADRAALLREMRAASTDAVTATAWESGASVRSSGCGPPGEDAMADLARLRRDARRAYEVARLCASLRVAFVIAPLTALCIWETRAVSRSVAMGVGLLVVVTILRWRQRNGFRVVSTGMCTGALPFAAALALCRFAPSFGSDAAFALCGSAGVVSGGLMDDRCRTRRPHRGSSGWALSR
jgi:hypothetical protein